MIFKVTYVSLAVLIVVFVTNSQTAWARSYVSYSDSFRKAQKYFKEIRDSIVFLEDAMNEIKDGKVPQPKNDEWKNLVSVATTISGGIKVEDLGKPSGIDRTRLEAELKKCETFEAAVKQTREHLVNLIETQPHLPQVVSDLTEAESHLAKAAESADKLGKLYAHLAVIPTPIPGVQHYFAWGVYDIEVVVKKAVNEAHGSVQKLLDMQKRRLEGYPKSIEGWQKFADETDVWLPKMRNACAAKP